MWHANRFVLVLVALSFAGRSADSADINPPVALREIVSALAPSNFANPVEQPKESPSGILPATTLHRVMVDDNVNEDATIKFWQEQSAKTRLVSGSYHRSEFNDVFEVEKAYTGKFVIETPYRWRVEEQPVKIKKGDISKKRGKGGDPYTLEPGRPETWVYTDDSVYVFDVEMKHCHKVDIPEESRHTEKSRCPLPTLFFFDAEAVQRKVALVRTRETNQDLLIHATPMNPPAGSGWPFGAEDLVFKFFRIEFRERSFLQLHKTLGQPTKVGFRFDSGHSTVYTFENVVIRPIDDEGYDPHESTEVAFKEEMLNGYKRYERP